MAWEWLEKYLKGGMATQGVPDVVGGEVPTRGLFGTGGQYGTGGLLTTFNQPSDPGKGMLDLFSNLPAVTGMEIIQGGMTGKPIEQTLMPAFKSGLVTTSAVEKVKASKRKQKFIKDYKDKVPKGDMELFLAFPEKYVSAMLTERMRTPTIAKEVLALFKESEHLKGDAFDKWYKNLSESKKFLYDKKIKPNLQGMAAFADALEKMEKMLGDTDETGSVNQLQEGFTENIEILVDGQTYRLPDGRIGKWNKKNKGFDFPETQ
jgi:hypothetical protein